MPLRTPKKKCGLTYYEDHYDRRDASDPVEYDAVSCESDSDTDEEDIDDKLCKRGAMSSFSTFTTPKPRGEMNAVTSEEFMLQCMDAASPGEKFPDAEVKRVESPIENRTRDACSESAKLLKIAPNISRRLAVSPEFIRNSLKPQLFGAFGRNSHNEPIPMMEMGTGSNEAVIGDQMTGMSEKHHGTETVFDEVKSFVFRPSLSPERAATSSLLDLFIEKTPEISSPCEDILRTAAKALRDPDMEKSASEKVLIKVLIPQNEVPDQTQYEEYNNGEGKVKAADDKDVSKPPSEKNARYIIARLDGMVSEPSDSDDEDDNDPSSTNERETAKGSKRKSTAKALPLANKKARKAGSTATTSIKARETRLSKKQTTEAKAASIRATKVANAAAAFAVKANGHRSRMKGKEKWQPQMQPHDTRRSGRKASSAKGTIVNWKGKEIKDGDGYVLVDPGNFDPSEYQRPKGGRWIEVPA